jgi:hypothetical protein
MYIKKPAYISPYVDKTPIQQGWRGQYVSNFQCPALLQNSRHNREKGLFLTC